MIYSFKTPMGSGNPESIALLVRLQTPSGEVRLSHNELFHSEMLEMLEKSNVFLKVKGVVGEDVPFITPYGGSMKDFTQLLQILNKLKSSNQLNPESAQLKGVMPKIKSIFGEEIEIVDLMDLYQAYTDFLAFKNKEVTVNMNVTVSDMVNPSITQKIVDTYKIVSRPKELWFLDENINVSSEMKTPEDRVYVRLPDYEELVTQEIADVFAAELPHLIKPYPSQQLYTPYYMDYIQTVDPSFDVKKVVGNPTNNDLPIQPNEEEFYKALCSLAEYTTKNKTHYGEASDEEIDRMAQLHLSTTAFANLDEDFRRLAIALLDKALAINYMHTGFVPISKVYDNDDDSNDDVEKDTTISTEEIGSSYEYYDTGKVRIGNASDIILAYLDGETNGDYKALCEAIVKLLRWGDRKPSKLKVVGAKKYLSLESFISESNSGNFASMEVKEIEGCTLLPSNYKITLSEDFNDMNYFASLGIDVESINLPVGLVLSKRYITEDGSGLVQDIHTSLIDIVYNLMVNDTSKNSKVFGIKLENNRIVLDKRIEKFFNKNVTLAMSVAEVTSDQESRVEFYQSGHIKDIFFKFNCMDKIKSSILYQLNRYRTLPDLGVLDANYTENETELLELCSEGYTPAECLTINMARQMVYVIGKVNSKVIQDMYNGIEANLEMILNYYLEVMRESNFNYGKFVSKDTGYVKNELEDVMGNNLDTMNSFDNLQKEEKNEDDRLGDKALKRLIHEVPTGVNVLTVFKQIETEEGSKKKLVCLMHETNINGTKKFVCVGTDRKAYNSVGNVNIIKFGNIALDILENIIKGTPENSNFRFSNEDVMKETMARLKL
ncbi:hypothetical protein [uncultured Clostridium sp.]|uniref:hypothetical protein n=1 Tax=uncultured Clostridium sp. TaxID=59620 RepID=UPI0026F386A9|nr:hypothetical protein [uncultured Clostridium sp.]